MLGRIAEVGQVRDTFTHVINDTFTRNEPLLTNWHGKLLDYRGQVTNTVYDIAYDGFTGVDPTLVVAQQNVRNRVSFVTYTDTPGLSSSWNQGSFYSYDIHGNVDTLLQDYGQSATRPNIMNKNGNRWKRFVYEYDLISGKVNTVKYQPGYSDQWTHRYYYDAENRLTEVQTSTDGFTWERDAKYEYYLHGPLARTVIGEQQVQGIDFAYTLQGWLKGVNSTGSTALYDIGSDGKVGSLNQYVGRDALGFNLNYFHGDYKPVNPGVAPTFPSYRLPGSGLPDSVYRPLYNGNISSMATHLRMFDAQWHVPILYNYKYDQLNRLVRQDAFFNFNAGTNSYSTDWGVDKTFHEQVSYDANGNIQNFVRHAIGRNGALMDDLAYKYYPGTNKLRQVKDQVSDNAYGSSAQSIQDLDNQPDTSNYVYDGIGNLVQDKQESITSIKWNVYGKITEINRVATVNNNVARVTYNYDAQGNRIGKVVDRSTGARNYTWYVRDAQGNLMSTYTSVDSNMRPPNNLDSLPLVLADRHIYGSSRLGVNPSDNSMDGGPVSSQFYEGSTFSRGWRQYELTNHLGNVLTTVSDRKIGVYSNGSLTLPNDSVYAVVDYYEPFMVSATDYYSFGMPSRKISAGDAGLTDYRYGFNGKENDSEVKGFGNQQDYGMRIYDPRLGRFLSVDPLDKKFPYWSPYHFSGNNPIRFIDLDGGEIMAPFTQEIAMDAAITIVSKPNSPKAKVYGAAMGIGNAITGAAEGIVNIVRKPIETVKGVGRMLIQTPGENALDYGMSMAEKYGDLPGPVQEYAVKAHILTDLSMALSPVKKALTAPKVSLGSQLIKSADDPMIAEMSRPLTEPLPSLSKGPLPTQTGFLDGSFSIWNWEGYPANLPKPKGPFRILEGAEYKAARDAANSANKTIKRNADLIRKEVEVHEVNPVVLGGNPTSILNKVIVDAKLHRQQITVWWNNLINNIKKNH